ncbi:hypothetical protein BI364_04245 [Acidihalobacter yilgarnensis]|uniref:Methyl-accepting chemotaxis protein n=1 Tax=Acidihalobacter yilgarnensis TaxID=2819280 RepID=A0A1D8ILH5_9GAMM|nr:methyl-accepting chemotaxis protein [Acidihalobacter yilgarnensis]AOU97308.1 hypothetical protein BI364_04245 [Acidihalobacter yilgarnensis]
MKNKSLNFKFGLMGASIAAVLLISFALIIANADRIRVDSANLRHRDIPIMEYAYQMQISVIQVQQFFSDAGAMRQQDSLQDDLKSAAEYRDRFHALIDKLIALNPERRNEYHSMLTKFDRYYQVGKDMADAYVNQGTAAGNQLMTGFDSAAGSIFETVNPFLTSSQGKAHALLAQQQATVVSTQWTLIFALLVILAVLTASGAALFRIVRKIPVVSSELNRIASGDLGGKELTHHSQDEIGQLCSGLNAMRTQLKTIMRDVSESSTHIATFSTQLSASIGQTENAISKQVSEISQIAAAMHEMSATSHEVAKNATDSASAAQQANQEVDAGNHAVEEAIQAIRSAANDIENVSSVIYQVDKSSDEIGTILDVIRDITDQTNLLALNAAIEAARAGEMGRGFAVVSDEVRTLAKRTQQSTQEIQNMIANLQAAAKNAVKAMKVSQQGVERSVTLAGTSGDRLTAISGAVGKISDMTTQIATAAEEQSAVTTEMNENISNISVATEQTEESAHQIAEAGRKMSDLATELQRLVSKFRV